jgi:Cu/Ag efflux protein CusF
MAAMRRPVLAALLALAVTATAVAHEKFKIVGTVAKVHAEQLDVKSVDGSIYEMDMFDSVAVFRNNRKVSKSELKPGVRVTVNALGHDFFDLEAIEVHVE